MDTENRNTDVELLDLLTSIWKNKIFIISGTCIVIAVCAVILSFITPVYKNVMVLRPGVIDISDSGTQIFLDSASNIAALINSGAYDEIIVQGFDQEELKNIPTDLNFNILIPNETNIINVEFESSDKKAGTRVLKELYDLLVQRYALRVATSQKIIVKDIKIARTAFSNVQYQIKLLEGELVSTEIEKKKEKTSIQSSISKFTSAIEVFNNQQNYFNNRIEKIKSEIKTSNKNKTALYKQQSLLLQDTIDKDNILSTMVYNNIINESVSKADNLAALLIELNDKTGELTILVEEKKQEINEKLVEKENIEKTFKIKIEDIHAQIEDKKVDELEKLAGIAFLESKKENCTNIVMIQPPLSGKFPVRPKKMMILVISAVAGLLFFLFLSMVISIVKKEI